MILFPNAAPPSTLVPEKKNDNNVREGEEEEGMEKTSMGKVSPNENTSSTKPNVFFIMIDDMGFNDIGYQSIDLQGTTPNLDKLAAGGVKVIHRRTIFLV